MNAELVATNRRLLGERPTPFAPAQVVVGHAASVGPASNGFASPAGSIAVGAQQAAHMRPQTAPPAPSLGGPASSIKRQRTASLIATTSAVSGTVGFQASLALRVAAQHTVPPTKAPSPPSFTAFLGSTPGSAHNQPKPVHPAPKHAPIHNAPNHASGVAAAAPTRTPVHAGLPRTSAFVPAPAAAPGAHAKVATVRVLSRPTPSLPSLSAQSFRPISASSSDASPSAAVFTANGAASIDTPMRQPPLPERDAAPVVEPTSAAVSAPTSSGTAPGNSVDSLMSEAPRLEHVHPQGVDLSGTTTTRALRHHQHQLRLRHHHDELRHIHRRLWHQHHQLRHIHHRGWCSIRTPQTSYTRRGNRGVEAKRRPRESPG